MKKKSETEDNKSVVSSTIPDDGSNYNKYIISAMIVAAFVVGFYFINFSGSDLSRIPSDWGVLGDYIGGILNPALAFITIVLLVHTIKQQHIAIRQTAIALEQNKQELEFSRAAIETSRNEVIETRKVTEAQEKALQQQNLTNNFYSIFSVLKERVNSFKYSTVMAGESSFGKFASEISVTIQKRAPITSALTKEQLFQICNEYRTKDRLEVIENILVPVLILLKNTSLTDDQKRYWISVVRCVMTDKILLLLCINGMITSYFRLFKLYEELSFFDSVRFEEEPYDSIMIRIQKMGVYDESAFDTYYTDSSD